jgi:threonine/homoserine efflux transporter RhtA
LAGKTGAIKGDLAVAKHLSKPHIRRGRTTFPSITPAGTALLGIWLLGEPASALRLACIGLIVGGITGSNWSLDQRSSTTAQ